MMFPGIGDSNPHPSPSDATEPVSGSVGAHRFSHLIPDSVQRLDERTSIPALFFAEDEMLYVPAERRDEFRAHAMADPDLLRETRSIPVGNDVWDSTRYFLEVTRRRYPEMVAGCNLCPQQAG